MGKKEIIIYTDRWRDGGIELFLLNQLSQWDLSKCHCTILSAEKHGDAFDQRLRDLNIHQDVLLKKEYRSAIYRILKTFAPLKKYLKEHPCDIIYFNLANSVGMRYAKIARQVGISRRIVHSHNSGIEPSRTKGIKLFGHHLGKILYTKYATDWWACSDIAAFFLFLPNVHKKVKYIPNGIQVDKFLFDKQIKEKYRKQWNINDENVKIIGTVGRCVTQKNQSFLLDVFASVHCCMPHTKLLLIGDGPLRPVLQEKAEKLGISDACIFYGFTENVAPLYSAIDIFCLPSVVEGFGIAALEAQAAGCGCILSDVVTTQLVLSDNVFVLPLQESAWVQQLTAMVRNDCVSNRNTEAGRLLAEKGFDISSSAKKVQQYIFE